MPAAEPLLLAPGVSLGDGKPLAIIAGINVLEDGELALRVAHHLQGVCAARGAPLVFKASFDKANRSSLQSYRGPGLARGLRLLERVKAETGLPLLTDIHAPDHAAAVAEVVDVLQIPAFLCRQTDLLAAAAATGRPLHVKKMQMMGPHDALAVARKCRALGAERVVLCERGTSHGYGNLVVDPLAVEELLRAGETVSVDITHAVQLPGAQGTSTGGRRWGVEPLARCMAALRVHALFFECHPAPEQARCDGPSAIPLAAAEGLVAAAIAVHEAARPRG